MIKIGGDADACPKVIKEVMFRAADRTAITVTLVANQPLRTPPSKYIRSLQVAAGFDVADNEIVRRCEAGDLVITADIPLAAEVIEKGAVALNPRGERYTPDTIRERLNMRDFMDTLRASGIQTGGPNALNQRDRQQFANELDKWLLQAKRAQGLRPALLRFRSAPPRRRYKSAHGRCWRPSRHPLGSATYSVCSTPRNSSCSSRFAR